MAERDDDKDYDKAIAKYDAMAGNETLQVIFGAPADALEVTNINVNDADESQVYIMVTGPEAEQLKKAANKELSILYFHAKPAEFINRETGEVRNGVRCVMVGEDGVPYSTSSPSAMRSIASHAKVNKLDGRFDPPFQCTVKLSGQSPREFLTLIPKMDKDALTRALGKKAKPRK
jgi:hypothetical protein